MMQHRMMAHAAFIMLASVGAATCLAAACIFLAVAVTAWRSRTR